MLRDMQDTDDPDRLREIFETDTVLRSYQRADLIRRAIEPLLEAGRQEEADKARWDAALFFHHRRMFARESEGRFGFMMQNSDGSAMPDPGIFTEEALDYYEQRARETNNPVLKSWYADFIWESRRDHVFARMAIQALHDTYSLLIKDGDRLHVAADSVVRPVRLARALRDSELVADAKGKAFVALEDFMTLEAHPAVRWALEPIDAVMEGGDVTKEEIAILLEATEQGEEFYAAASKYHLARSFAKRVVTLLRRSDARDGARDAELRIGRYHEAEAERADSHFGAAVHLQDAIQHYADVGSGEDVERLKKELYEHWTAAQGEFKQIEADFEFPAEQVREWARALLALGVDQALLGVACDRSLIPVIESVKERSRELADEFPLKHLFTRVTIDGPRQVHRAGSPEESEKAEVFYQYGFNLLFLSLFVDVTFAVFRDEGGLDAATMSDVLQRSPFIDGDTAEVLEVGLERYLSGDFVSAMHVLIPQLEDVLRRMLRLLGGPTTSIRDGVTLEIYLNQVLDAPEMEHLLGKNTIFYLRYLLVEQLGRNLRNRVAHGLIRKSECDRPTLALVVMSLLRLVPYKAETESTTEGPQPSD